MVGHLTRDASGHLNKLVNGHLAKDITISCDEGVYAGLPECVKIDGYVDGDLVAGGSCVDCTNSALPAWDGTFTKTLYLHSFQWICGWGNGVAGIPHTDPLKSINGKRLGHQTEVRFLQDLCEWHVTVYCDLTTRKIWAGTKNVGMATPLGTYTRQIDSCDPTATLTIVAC